VTERQWKAGLKNWHRILGIGAALFLMVSAVTGFLLQHPGRLGGPNGSPSALAADPRDPGRLLRGTAWGVEESLDHGATWRELPMLAPPTDVFRIHFDATDPARVFALGPRAAVTASDGGRIWEDLVLAPDHFPPGAEIRDVATPGGGVWLLLTSAGILRSADGGATWARAGEAPPREADWVSLVHDLHTGRILGTGGRRIAELAALALVFLTVSGLFLAFRRNRRRP
jgi:hypothetical protein